MLITIYQMIALIVYGNEAVKKEQTNKVFLNNSTIRNCNKVTFTLEEAKQRNGEDQSLETNVNEWFEYLIEKKCEVLKLTYISTDDRQYQIIPVTGSEIRWLIQARYEGYCEYWGSEWHVDYGKIPRTSVTYKKVRDNDIPQEKKSDLYNLKNELENCLTSAAKFSLENDVTNWTNTDWVNIFESAKKVFENNQPYLVEHNDILPVTNSSLIARQLISAASKAWVFGGMGSWSDLEFSEERKQQEYEDLTGKLYNAVCQAVVGGVNLM